MKTQKNLHKLQQHLHKVNCLVAYEHRFASAAEDLQIKITDLNKLQQISNLVGHRAHVVDMKIHPT